MGRAYLERIKRRRDSGHGFLFQYPELCGNNFSNFLDQAEISEGSREE